MARAVNKKENIKTGGITSTHKTKQNKTKKCQLIIIFRGIGNNCQLG